MNRYKSNKLEIKDRIIKRQINEIEILKEKISDLEIKYEQKKDLINSVDVIRNDLSILINNLKDKGVEYDKLIDELTEMRNSINKVVFKGKWKLVRWLLK